MFGNAIFFFFNELLENVWLKNFKFYAKYLISCLFIITLKLIFLKEFILGVLVVVGFVQFRRELAIRNSTPRIVDVMYSDGSWFWFILVTLMRFCVVVAKFLLFF